MLVVALMLLVVLTLIGITTTNTSRVEIQIAGNDRFHRIAFHLADSGTYATPKVISTCMDQTTEPTLAGVTYLGTSGSLYRELMGFAPHDADRDLRFVMRGYNVDVDVARIRQEKIAGRGSEFASGAEGVGAGSLGGVAVIYEIDSMAPGPSAALSDISALYRQGCGRSRRSLEMNPFKGIPLFILFLLLLSAAEQTSATEPTMAEYTSYPIFKLTAVAPNILIILDNSTSMNEQAS
jgi:hypothetical protein